MIFEEVPVEADEVFREMVGMSGGYRTRDQPHVSDIYKSLNQTLDPKRFSDDGGPNMSKMEVGLLFESILEEALTRKYGSHRVGEVGIRREADADVEGTAEDEEPPLYLGTPDSVNPTDDALEEFKCTWQTSRHGLVDLFGMPHQKVQHWFWQMKAYCKALGCHKAILTVLFVNGDNNRAQEGGMQPEFRRYKMSFTQEELDENWRMLSNHAYEKGI